MAKTSVLGIYRTREQAADGVDALRVSGYRSTDISALLPDNVRTKDFAQEKNTNAPEGAAGAVSGVLLNGALGWLAGALAIPRLGPFIAAGPIMAALAGTGAVGVTMTGALAGLGVPENEAKRYESRIRDGGILLSVHCDNSGWVDRAKYILESTGAQDVAAADEAQADFSTATSQATL